MAGISFKCIIKELKLTTKSLDREGTIKLEFNGQGDEIPIQLTKIYKADKEVRITIEEDDG